MLSTIIFLLDTRLDYFKSVRSALSTLVYPLQLIASFPSDVGRWYSDYFQSRDALEERNKELEAANLLNNVRLQRLQALERENMRLHELLGSSFRLPERVIAAELLTIDVDPFSQQVVINKGENHGVFAGQPVLDAMGVMGQVTEVSHFSSRVILLTDPSHSIPVQVNRNGLRAVVTGRGLGEMLKLDFMPHNMDIREGDLLVTSGLGGRFPTGYPVGIVSFIEYIEGRAFADITVTPSASLATSREVLLVQPDKSEISVNIDYSASDETEKAGYMPQLSEPELP